MRSTSEHRLRCNSIIEKHGSVAEGIVAFKVLVDRCVIQSLSKTLEDSSPFSILQVRWRYQIVEDFDHAAGLLQERHRPIRVRKAQVRVVAGSRCQQPARGEGAGQGAGDRRTSRYVVGRGRVRASGQRLRRSRLGQPKAAVLRSGHVFSIPR